MSSCRADRDEQQRAERDCAPRHSLHAADYTQARDCGAFTVKCRLEGWHPMPPASLAAIPSHASTSCGSGRRLTFRMRVRRKQLRAPDHPLLLVIVKPILAWLKAGYDLVPSRRRMLRCMLARRTVRGISDIHRTPHSGGDVTTSLSATPGIPRTHRHLASEPGLIPR